MPCGSSPVDPTKSLQTLADTSSNQQALCNVSNSLSLRSHGHIYTALQTYLLKFFKCFSSYLQVQVQMLPHSRRQPNVGVVRAVGKQTSVTYCNVRIKCDHINSFIRPYSVVMLLVQKFFLQVLLYHLLTVDG